MNETTFCPECRKEGNEVVCRHIASDAWRCPRCDFEFQLNIMPEVELTEQE